MPAHRRGAPRPERRCHMCDKTFGKTEHLERHIRSHTRDKPFTCNVCGKSFSRNDTLLRHWRSHNLPGPPPNASAAQARRPQMYPVPNANQPTQAVGNRTQMDTSLDNGYPPSGIQGYHQNFPDRHTEAASALVTIRGVDPENGQNAHEQGLNFPSAGQDTEAQVLQGYAEGALDPMLAMSEAQIQPNHEDTSVNQFTQQYPESHQAPYSFVDPQVDTYDDVIDLDPPSQSDDLIILPDDFDFNGLHEMITASALVGAPSPSPTLNGAEDSALRGIEPPPGPIPRTIWPIESFKVATRSAKLPAWMEHQIHVPMSNNFWEYCSHMFFDKFNSVLPVVHAPTYRPPPLNAALSLVTIAIGSLFAGSRAQADVQIEDFPKVKRFLKAECNNLKGGEPFPLALLQACVLAEAFALIIGQPTDPRRYWRQPWLEMLLEEKHGSSPTTYHRQEQPSPTDLEQMWNHWAVGEARRRTLHCALVIGSELNSLSALTSQVTKMMSNFAHVPAVAPEAIWQAPTAREWYDRVSNSYDLISSSFLSQPDPETTSVEHILAANVGSGHQTSRLTAYTLLERIITDIQVGGSRGGEINDESTRRREELAVLYTRHCSEKQTRVSDPFDLAILWHMAWCEELVDYHTLESCFGCPIQPWAEARDAVRRWAASPDAQRCLVHAIMIERYVSRFRYLDRFTIHVPRALYVAGLIILAYTKFKPTHDPTRERQEEDTIESHAELQQVARSMNRNLGALGALFHHGNHRGMEITRRLIDLLAQTNVHFEVSIKYAGALEALAAVESWEEEWVKASLGFAH